MQNGVYISLSSNYFLLYHGTSYDKTTTQKLNETLDDESFFEIAALLLSLNRKSFEAFANLKSFRALLSKMTPQKLDTLEALYMLQNSIIKHFVESRNKKRNVYYLHNALNYLHEQKVLKKLSLEKLISLFDPALLHKKSTKNKEFVYENFTLDKERILQDIELLKTLFDSCEKLDSIENYLNSQSFSIGVTGVMNAGKSTMLNALMGAEVLGVNVVPETANLTIIKHSKTPSVKLTYWNQEEWCFIEMSSKHLNTMKSFVKETKEYFGDDLSEYIHKSSKIEQISEAQLSQYTSAKDKKSHLIKSVELGLELAFLEEGIEIVDTPGLDDRVVQREEITKEYLSRCDVMIHLMSVSQSATLKDIEFILDAVLYQNVSKLLIVITRIDTASKADVAEVIEYTKRTIATKLHEQNSDSQLEYVLETLEFKTLSAKMALMHKTGASQEAQNASFSLEESGILGIQEYIQETLFSKENTRSALIIHSAKKRLKEALNLELQELQYENSLLFKTEGELDRESHTLQAKKAKLLERFELLKSQIVGYEFELLNYLSKLQLFLHKELKELQGVLKKRLIDETLYTLQKRHCTPNAKDIKRILHSTLKHGLMDILREYRYEFIKKAQEISEIITLQYEDIQRANQSQYSAFDPSSVFAEAFERGFVNSNYEIFLHSIEKLLSKTSLKKLLKTDAELMLIIKDEFITIEEQLKAKALLLSQELLKEFILQLKEPITAFERTLQKSEQVLEKHRALLSENATTRERRSQDYFKRIQMIQEIAQRYLS